MEVQQVIGRKLKLPANVSKNFAYVFSLSKYIFIRLFTLKINEKQETI